MGVEARSPGRRRVTGPFDPAFLSLQFPDLRDFVYVTAGGQKSVYSAAHSHYGKVALKIFPPSADVTRFERELDAVKGLACDAIPEIYSSGRFSTPHGECLWFVESWLDGESLRELLLSGPIHNAVVIRVAVSVLSVLKQAEAKRIVHRDVKPENIVVSKDGKRCWLLDFGIARHLERTTVTVGIFGPCTPGYSPPEQFRNIKDDIDARADLFALGVTLYECVEGVNPFREGTADPAEMCHRVESAPLPPVSCQIDRKNEFSDFVLALTRTKRTHRLPSAADASDWANEIAAGGVS